MNERERDKRQQTKYVMRCVSICWSVDQWCLCFGCEYLDARIYSPTHTYSHLLSFTITTEIRTGLFAPGVDKLYFEKGNLLTLTTDVSYRATDTRKLACSYGQLATSVKTGQSILIADGSLVLTVLECNLSTNEVTCRVENTTAIGERKNMNLPGVIVDLPTFTEKDVKDIVEFGIAKKVDFIAASFVRKASDVVALKELLAEHGGQGIKVVCKIENQEGLENYNAILAETDAIMVARGDLGMEIPPAKVFLAQKLMIRQANIAGKPVITATQVCFVFVFCFLW